MTNDLQPTTTSSPTDDVRKRAHARRRGGAGGLHACAACQVSFSTATNLERHVREQHDGRGATCHLCGATFRRCHLLQAHLLRHTFIGGRFQCAVCACAVPTRADLARHVRSHQQPDGGTACPVCGVVFGRYWQMRRHRALHAAARHACVVCDRLFQYRGRLVQHLRTHVGDAAAQRALDALEQKRTRPARKAPLNSRAVNPTFDGAVQAPNVRTCTVENDVVDTSENVVENTLPSQMSTSPVSLIAAVPVPVLEPSQSVSALTIPEEYTTHPMRSAPVQIVSKAMPISMPNNGDSKRIILNNVTSIIPKSSSFRETFPTRQPKIRRVKRRHTPKKKQKTSEPKHKYKEMGTNILFTVDTDQTKKSAVSDVYVAPAVPLGDLPPSSSFEGVAPHVDAASVDHLEDYIAPESDSLLENVDRVAGFGGEPAPRRPLTLEEAVRQITGDDPAEDPSTRMEFSAEGTETSVLGSRSRERDFSPFEPTSSPAEELNTTLTGRHELGFELEVASLHEHDDEFGASAQPFEDLRLVTNSVGTADKSDADTLQFELALNVDDDHDVVADGVERCDGSRDDADSQHPHAVELEVDAGELEGNIGDNLVQLLESGVRVEVEQQSQTPTETIMVITLVDE